GNLKGYGTKYLEKFGILEPTKNYIALIFNTKIFGIIFSFKLFLEILNPMLRKHALVANLAYMFKFVDFLIFTYLLIILHNLMSLFLQRVHIQIKESDNESVQNYLFLVPLVSNLGSILIFVLFFLLLLNLFG